MTSLGAFNVNTSPVEVLKACNATMKTLQADAGSPLPLYITLPTILFPPFDFSKPPTPTEQCFRTTHVSRFDRLECQRLGGIALVLQPW